MKSALKWGPPFRRRLDSIRLYRSWASTVTDVSAMSAQTWRQKQNKTKSSKGRRRWESDLAMMRCCGHQLTKEVLRTQEMGNIDENIRPTRPKPSFKNSYGGLKIGSIIQKHHSFEKQKVFETSLIQLTRFSMPASSHFSKSPPFPQPMSRTLKSSR